MDDERDPEQGRLSGLAWHVLLCCGGPVIVLAVVMFGIESLVAARAIWIGAGAVAAPAAAAVGWWLVRRHATSRVAGARRDVDPYGTITVDAPGGEQRSMAEGTT